MLTDAEARAAWERLRSDRREYLLYLALSAQHRREWTSRCDARHTYLARHKLIERVATGRARLGSLWRMTPFGERVAAHGKQMMMNNKITNKQIDFMKEVAEYGSRWVGGASLATARALAPLVRVDDVPPHDQVPDIAHVARLTDEGAELLGERTGLSLIGDEDGNWVLLEDSEPAVN